MLISKFADCSEDELLKLEERFGITLPKLYKDFLIRYNGGDTPKTSVKIGKTSTDVRGFFGVGSANMNFDKFDPDEWCEREMLPIAEDSFGNYFSIDKEGKIYFCDHEKGYRSQCVADDLKKFISRCKNDVISETAKKTVEEREAYMISKGRGHLVTDGLRKMWQAEYDKYSKMVQEEVKI
ncbi:MAG: SMI1/KNR4 family protein [Lachnospiraceae bacterium]|nr:SMI1/KNR4 family protein [Lachnospiraceae bacterium]